MQHYNLNVDGPDGVPVGVGCGGVVGVLLGGRCSPSQPSPKHQPDFLKLASQPKLSLFLSCRPAK